MLKYPVKKHVNFAQNLWKYSSFRTLWKKLKKWTYEKTCDDICWNQHVKKTLWKTMWKPKASLIPLAGCWYEATVSRHITLAKWNYFIWLFWWLPVHCIESWHNGWLWICQNKLVTVYFWKAWMLDFLYHLFVTLHTLLNSHKLKLMSYTRFF